MTDQTLQIWVDRHGRPCDPERNGARAEAKRLREALEWYAEAAQPVDAIGPHGERAPAWLLKDDGGQRARDALHSLKF